MATCPHKAEVTHDPTNRSLRPANFGYPAPEALLEMYIYMKVDELMGIVIDEL
jgi:hypothetical protein